MQENRPIGKLLRLERARLGLSQAQLAEAGGVSKTTQVSYEADSSRPDSDYLSGIAKLGIDVGWLITGRRSRGENWDLIEELLELIEEWATDRGRPTSVTERAALLRNLYGQFRSSGQIDPEEVRATFKLVQ
jgi:transcriptional regulator with XRE-family HTH domain